ncbi:MAG: ankyrin repeat domain-containing protein [Verrucomicrobia bacterium]|nr:ankyrin repeat domain-containing protein [Verrucomicrobiota bacterium]MBS0636099.1 ankyrin repeat domain-containing protein [Verrucomicrobiota bacterium]
MIPNDIRTSQDAIAQYEKGLLKSEKPILILHNGVLKCVQKNDVKIRISEHIKAIFNKDHSIPKEGQITLSVVDIIKSFFGKGPASFKQIAQFCGQKKIGGCLLTQALCQYNKTHWLWKKVSSKDQIALQLDALITYFKNPEMIEKVLNGRNTDDIVTVLESIRDNKPLTQQQQDSIFPILFCQSIGLHFDELAEKFLNEDIDVNRRGFDQATPLHIAAAAGNERLAKILLSKKADLSARDVFGFTPFLAACSYGNEKMVKLLLKNGPKSQLYDTDNNGRTAAEIAKSTYNYHIEDLIKKAI